jgi:hypothetical protein
MPNIISFLPQHIMKGIITIPLTPSARKNDDPKFHTANKNDGGIILPPP